MLQLIHLSCIKNLYTRQLLQQRTFHQKLFKPEASWTRSFYTRQTPFTPKNFRPDTVYTRSLFHQNPAFTPGTTYTRRLQTRRPFTPKNFHTRRSLHQNPFTPKALHTKELLCLQKRWDCRSHIKMNVHYSFWTSDKHEMTRWRPR